MDITAASEAAGPGSIPGGRTTFRLRQVLKEAHQLLRGLKPICFRGFLGGSISRWMAENTALRWASYPEPHFGPGIGCRNLRHPVLGLKPYPAARFFRWLHQFADGCEYCLEVLVMQGMSFFQFFQAAGKVLVRRKKLTDAHESTHDGDIDLDGLETVENARQHGDALFRKYQRQFAAATTTPV